MEQIAERFFREKAGDFMAVVLEKRFSGGGCGRLHIDENQTEAEKAMSRRAFELTVEQLVKEGSLVLPGVERGASVSVKLVKKEV